ncbi:MAG: glycosyltransferase family 2 protein [Duncaniella sp.]|uniref:glycosyltransferase family 2 protein n=1 Tax=Duncaniella sp. TaxID=2518496 RepID=UPI0023D69F20|nr:glycosyltransferase family 2 protein [Duncaniella sp.]MDE5988002.1 glycosyltransferase family 2 protein [Duncaniella sp.]
MESSKLITILVPAYNEAASLPKLHNALSEMANKISKYRWEFLIVNDGSSDNTAEILKEMQNADRRISYINLSRNFGKESAMAAGIDHAQGDALIIMDADLQHPVSAIPKMIAEWEKGYDDVYGKRLSRGKESWLRKKLSLLYYSLLQKNTKINILPNVGDFRLLDRKCLDAMKNLRETQRYTKGLFCWIGFKKCPVEYETNDRENGVSSFRFSNLLGLAIDGITGFTISPLRIASVIGVAVSAIAFIYLIVVIAKTLFYGEPVQGYPTLLCVILILGGCQLLTIGIIGEYIGRIFNETKNRPSYIIMDYSQGKRNHQPGNE